jgi:hypothetical protein
MNSFAVTINKRGIARNGVARTGRRETHTGKPERERPLGSSRSRWEDIIKMDLKEIKWEGVDWIQLA